MILLVSAGCFLALAQETPFDLQIYRDFISANEDISPAGLHGLYPSDIFKESVTPFLKEDVLYLDLARDLYNFTPGEMNLLHKNGFMVTERLNAGSFLEQFRQVYKKDLPVFISTDAILHAVHLSYDEILKEVELNFLISSLTELLSLSRACLPELDQQYGQMELMQPMLRDVDVYLTVPLLLQGENVTPFYPENKEVISQFLNLIEAEEMKPVVFFSDTLERKMDFSQFKPRGHYEVEEWEGDALPNYFRAMMWLGRTELYLDHPDIEKEEDVRKTVYRQIIDAALIHEILAHEEIRQLYGEMEDLISFFVGDQDNVYVDLLDEILMTSGITGADQLLDESNMETFLEKLRKDPGAGQQILSQVLKANCSDTATAIPSAFMVFGQRFVIDSYVTGQVVYDRILYDQNKPCRLLPSTLDIMFALGNDASTQLLLPELHQWKYSDNLAGLRFLIDQYEADFWESSLYNLWLYAIKSLNPDPKDESMPEFMQTGAWGLEKLNTQLASWTELRHDNLLYAKQSYTWGGDCSHPSGYVEPNPEFFARLKRMAFIAAEKFSDLSYEGPYQYFKSMYAICDTLETIAMKELSGEEISEQECSFFDDVSYSGIGGSGGGEPDGWYSKLIYSALDPFAETFLVADYHTVPVDCGGKPLGWVAHAGTGYADLMVAVAPLADGQPYAFLGPVASYHEYRTSDFLRLTDSDWKASYLEQSLRPEWVYGYLADQSGQTKETSLKLFSDMESFNKALQTGIPSSIALNPYKKFAEVNISPNPVIQSTIITIRIPEELRNRDMSLLIYNIEGKLLKNLVDVTLPPGNYMTRWDRTDEAGSLVPPGMYILKLGLGEYGQSLKLLVAD